MANSKNSAKKNTTRKSSASKNSSSKKNSTRTANSTKTAAKSTNKTVKQSERLPVQNYVEPPRKTEGPSILVRFLCSPVSKPIILILLILIIIGIDLLSAWNDYTRFFLILGFELLIAGIAWILFLAISSFNAENKSN